jgi:hypothetical protein
MRKTKQETTAERISKMIATLDEMLSMEKSYCVECGASTELDCLCDELNHDDQPLCSEANKI